MSYTLNDKQKSQLDKPLAADGLRGNYRHGLVLNGFIQTELFHLAVDLPVRSDWSYIPTVSERLLRGKLLVEEVLETLNAMGLTLMIDGVYANQSFEEITVAHVEGSRYDPIETADGLADIKVIANGTALTFGIPQLSVDEEVWASNMSKLDENGNPIVNRPDPAKCSNPDDCVEQSHLIDPKQPVGKVLKPSTYTKANIARLYQFYTEGKI